MLSNILDNNIVSDQVLFDQNENRMTVLRNLKFIDNNSQELTTLQHNKSIQIEISPTSKDNYYIQS